MGKLKINVIAHQLNNGKVANFGDIVDEKELNGNITELERKGYVVKFESSEGDVPVDLNRLNKTNLIEYALKNGVTVDSSKTKAEIKAEILEKLED